MSKNQYAHQRGEIQESAIKALVTDPLFKTRVMRNRKGKAVTNVKQNMLIVIKAKAHLK